MAETLTYNGPLGLDKLPWWAKTITWLLCMIVLLRIQVDPLYEIASTSWFPFSLSRHLLEQYSVILGSMCLALTWLRLTGIKWRYALFFPIINLIASMPFVLIMIIVNG